VYPQPFFPISAIPEEPLHRIFKSFRSGWLLALGAFLWVRRFMIVAGRRLLWEGPVTCGQSAKFVFSKGKREWIPAHSMNSESETEFCLTEELHPSVQWIQAVAFEAKNCRTNKGTPALQSPRQRRGLGNGEFSEHGS
jgi:hypothetical protein